MTPFWALWHCQRGKLGGKRVTCQAKLLTVRIKVDLTHLEAQDEDAEGALSPVGRAVMIKLSFAWCWHQSHRHNYPKGKLWLHGSFTLTKHLEKFALYLNTAFSGFTTRLKIIEGKIFLLMKHTHYFLNTNFWVSFHSRKRSSEKGHLTCFCCRWKKYLNTQQISTGNF